MLSKIFSLFLALYLVLSFPATAENGTVTCVFDGFAVDYPEELKLAEDDTGLFFVGQGGFIQINTQVLPVSAVMPMTKLLESGAVEHLKQNPSEGFTYVSDGEIRTIGQQDYIYLEAKKGTTPFYQYITIMGHTMILFTVKGEACGKMAPQVLASLREASQNEVKQNQYTGDPNIRRVTRQNKQGQEEPAGFSVQPYPVHWADFRKGFFDTMLELTGETDVSVFPVSRCCFTDGRWARVFTYGAVVVLFYTDGPEETDTLTQVSFSASLAAITEKQISVAASSLLLSCAIGIGAAHQETVDRFAGLIDTGFPQEKGDDIFWSDNGFGFYLGRSPEGNFFGRAVWLGQTEKTLPAVPDILSDVLPPMNRPDLTADKLVSRHNLICQTLTHGTQLNISPRGVPSAENGKTVLSYTAAQGLFRMKVYLSGLYLSSPVARVHLECGIDASGLMEVECLAAFCASADLDAEGMITVIALAGDVQKNLWTQMCGKKPFVRLDGVSLQAAEDGGMMIAEVYGGDD